MFLVSNPHKFRSSTVARILSLQKIDRAVRDFAVKVRKKEV